MKHPILHSVLLAVLATALPAAHAAGIFTGAAGTPGSNAVAATSPEILGWATAVVSYTPGTHVDPGFQTPAKALGVAGNSDGNDAGFAFDMVSLGRGGSITLTLDRPIMDGVGYDFAVFENSFSDTFLELAWVEVSSDGSSFFRFPAFSLTPGPVGAFGAMDPTGIEGMAGKHRGGFGTPFDLAQLADRPGLDVGHVSYVRLVDVVGDGSAPNDLDSASLAQWFGVAQGDLPAALVALADNAPNAIYDPYPTVGSAGFDLDALGVMNVAPVPVPAAGWLLVTAIGSLWLRRRSQA